MDKKPLVEFKDIYNVILYIIIDHMLFLCYYNFIKINVEFCSFLGGNVIESNWNN